MILFRWRLLVLVQGLGDYDGGFRGGNRRRGSSRYAAFGVEPYEDLAS